MIQKIIKNKKILSIYIVVILALVLGVTYAIGTYSIALNVTTAVIELDTEAYGNTTFSFEDIDFKPILDSEVETNTQNVIKIDFTVGGASTNNNDNIIYDIALADLDMDPKLFSSYIKWKLIKDGDLLSEGNFEYMINKKDKSRFVLTKIQEDLPDYNEIKDGYHNYTFYMWFSDSCQNADVTTCFDKEDQSELVGKPFSGKIEVELYTESKKALVRNPSDTLKRSTCGYVYPEEE